MAGQARITLSAAEIAEIVDGRVHGDCTRQVFGVAFVGQGSPDDLVFINHDRLLQKLPATDAKVIIAPEHLANRLPVEDAGRTFILVKDAEAAFLKMTVRIAPERRRPDLGVSPQAIVSDTAVIGPRTNVHPLAVIGDDVSIGENCDIGAGVVVGDGCVIGDDVRIDPGCVLYPDVEIGNQVILQANTVLGACGYGYRTVDGQHELLPHVGIVRIDDDVHIGAGCTVDRAKVGATTIGRGTRIDNMVVVAHNCRIGRHNLMMSQTGIAGSSSTGDYVVCAGQAGVADHVHLGDGAVIGAKTGVHRDMQGGQAYLGIPARDARLHAREQSSLKHLPEMRSTVKKLQKQVAELQAQLAALEGAYPESGDSTGLQEAA